jgi:hypothetical protein
MTLLACAAVVGLAAASSAMAAFTPQLAVSNNPPRTGASGTTILRVTVPRDHDALFRADFYVPAGYVAPLTQSAGTTVGTVAAQVLVQEPVAGAVLPVQGNILVENPANHTTSPCSPGLHAAVWMLVLAAAGQELRVPAYVDPTTGTETALGAYKIRACLPSPHIPASLGGATFGAKLIRAQLNFTGVFTTPSASGDYPFRLVATPWAPPATPNAAATTESIAHMLLPARFTLRGTSRKRVLTVRGTLFEGPEAVGGQRIVVRIGRRNHTVRTTAGGAFRVTVRFRRRTTTTVRASAAVPVRTETCPTGPSPAPAGCVSNTKAFYSVTSARIRVRVR